MAQQTSYSYNYQYSWQTTGSAGGQPPQHGPGPTEGAPPYYEEKKTTNEDGSQTTTVTGGYSTGTTTETGPTDTGGDSPRSESIGAGFDHTYLRSIEGILRLISIVSLKCVIIYGLLKGKEGGGHFLF